MVEKNIRTIIASEEWGQTLDRKTNNILIGDLDYIGV